MAKILTLAAAGLAAGEPTVATTHPAYNNMLDVWEACDDVGFGGARAVKAAGTKYLPMLAWEENAHDQYEAYLRRAVCPNAVVRTRIAVEGQVFRVSPKVTIDESLLTHEEAELFLEHFTTDGASFAIYARRLFSQVFGMGRGIGVVDATSIGELRATTYGALGMTNWWPGDVEGETRGVQAIFAEREYRPYNRYGRVPVDVRREFVWVPGPPPDGYGSIPGATGHVQVVEHRRVEADGTSKWLAGAPAVPSIRGVAFSQFPVTVVNPYDLGYACTEPPLAEMVDVNLSLYRTSADLEHGRHFAGVPAPYVFGVKKGTTIQLGSSKFLTSENPQARAGFIEFTAQGLKALETAVVEKTRQLIEAGARLFAPQPGAGAAVSTYEAGRLAATADWSIVESVARTTSAGLRQIIAQMIAFARRIPVADVLPLVTVMLNTDYEPMPLGATDAARWTEAYLQGGISRETMHAIFERGGIYPPGWTLEDELASIEADRAEREAQMAARGPQGNRPGRLPGRTPEGNRLVDGTRDPQGESQGSPTRSDGQP